MSGVSEQIKRDAECCPNCTKHGSHDVSQDEFQEWRCTNTNCRVEVYRVRFVEPDSDHSDGGEE